MNALEEILEREIHERISSSSKLARIYNYLRSSQRISSLLEMANIVLVHRLKYNDHGKIHALITARNSLKIVDILGPEILVTEDWRTFEDSKVIVLIASYLHDIGNSIHRDEHELLGVVLAKPFVEEMLSLIYDDESKSAKIASMVYESIMCHMGRYEPTSVEAGVVATADGCDMEQERARLPFRLGGHDIHKYSALSIERVELLRGEERPLRIEVYMRDPSGTFQIEEILMKKIKGTNFERFVEIYANIIGKEIVRFI